MNKNLKRKSGITLISLITTIIILIILAGTSLYLVFKSDGIVNKTIEARDETTKTQATEKINFKITTAQINNYIDNQKMPTLKELSLVLKEDNEIEYVTETKQIASIKYEVGEDPITIFTKLKDYPYEFEINSKLQLASINGVEVAIESDSGNRVKAYVLGEITSYISLKGQSAAQGYTSNEEYFTCEGGVDRNYLIVNVLKDTDVFIVLQEAGRGSYTQKIIQINDTIVSNITLAPGVNHEYTTKVFAGDIIKITSNGENNAVKGTAICILSM